jgi:hypothetical protein
MVHHTVRGSLRQKSYKNYRLFGGTYERTRKIKIFSYLMIPMISASAFNDLKKVGGDWNNVSQNALDISLLIQVIFLLRERDCLGNK